MLTVSDAEKLSKDLFMAGGGSPAMDEAVMKAFWTHLEGVSDPEFHPTTSVDDALMLVQGVDPRQEVALVVKIVGGQCSVTMDGLGAVALASGVEDHRAKVICECVVRWWIAHERAVESEADGA